MARCALELAFDFDPAVGGEGNLQLAAFDRALFDSCALKIDLPRRSDIAKTTYRRFNGAADRFEQSGGGNSVAKTRVDFLCLAEGT